MNKITHCINHNRFIAVDTEELTGLELIGKNIDTTNEIIDELNNKTDLIGDHKGSWQGINKPTLSEEGMRGQVEKNQADILSLNDNKKNSDNLVIGMEYLIWYHEKMRKSEDIKLIFSGDSTTYGTNLQYQEYKVNNLAKRFIENNGYIGNVTSLNRGYESMTSGEWIRNYLVNDIAENPDLYILRWGLNDGGYPSSTRLQRFIENMENGLKSIRVSKPPNALSILILMPNMCNEPVGRNKAWLEEIYPHLQRLSRKYSCCFADTTHYLYDNTTVLWQDQPMGDGITRVHPFDIANVWINDFITDLLYPKTLRGWTGEKNISLLGGWNNEIGSLIVKNINGIYMLKGCLTGGTMVSGTTIGKLPTHLIPPYLQFISCDYCGTDYVVKNVLLTINTNGDIKINETITGNTRLIINGFYVK